MTPVRLTLALLMVLASSSGCSDDPVGTSGHTCEGRPATIVGTDHRDRLQGTDGDDVAWLGPGADRFRGLGGDDVVCGGNGADVLEGDEGNDVLLGEDGNDHFAEGAGDDRLDGGEGSRDMIDFVGWRSALRIDMRAGTVLGAGSDAVAHVEGVYGTPPDDVYHGTSGDDAFRSEGGMDRVRTFAGDDDVFLTGFAWLGPGNDSGAAFGRSRLHLGPGDDGANARDAAVVYGGAGQDWCRPQNGTGARCLSAIQSWRWRDRHRG